MSGESKMRFNKKSMNRKIAPLYFSIGSKS